MLSCPICQTTLDNDSIHGGRCFSCGSQVVWQGQQEKELVAVGEAPAENTAHSDHRRTMADFEPAPIDERSSPATLAEESDPAPFKYPAKRRPNKPRSRNLSIEQSQAINTIWGDSFGSGSTPMTSLRSSGSADSTRKSTLVIRSRALSRPSQGLANIGADYELIDQIGEGGMGVVYSARQASIDRTVAVKMLRNDIADLTEPRDKFLSEAVVTAELDHPNIVPIHDLGASNDGALFYSMKRVQGTPWCDVLFEKTIDENLTILLKVCDAVRFAHTKGVVHRDLKPENVMLGDFGEVLVMDWGLAIATTAFRCPDSITQSSSMGGTPAYMAPEMATGPMDEINELSDIYLLGAILYEVLTKTTPHFGKDPMECLRAAAANKIQPTNESGELLDIAMKAMSTTPMDRHQSVGEFQEEIENYRSHAESILLSDRAERQLRSAHETQDYQEFAGALHGFKEAILLWQDNPAALAGLPESRLAYAKCAATKEDFDLAASLLDSKNADHKSLISSIDRKRRERDNRQQRLRTLKVLAAGLVVLVIAIGSLAFVMIRNDRNRAITAGKLAIDKMKEAEVAKTMEEEQRLAAVASQEKAEESRAAAERAAQKAAESAAEAKRQEAKAARESYLALIGLVAARAEENAFREANGILDVLANSPYRHWEWGRLRHVCAGSAQMYTAVGRVNAVAVDESFTRVAAGTRNGTAAVWQIEGGVRLFELRHNNQWVHDIAFSPDGELIATGSSDGRIRLFQSSNGQLISTVEAHPDSILSVAFSNDGQSIATSSYDKTVAIWDLSDPRSVLQQQKLQGHSWWVHDVAFSKDGQRIVSAGHDGKVIVWAKQDADTTRFSILAEFTGHIGPVFAVTFSPDGKLVATGGHDKRLMVWDYARQDTTSIRDQLNGILATPPEFRAFDGHRAAIRSVAFSPDGTRLVSGSADNTLKVWDTTTGDLHRTLRGHERAVRAAVFAPNNRQIVSGSFDETVRIWNVGEFRESRMLGAETVDGHADAVLDARFSSDGKNIVTASRDRTARIWNNASSEMVHELSEGHDYLASAATFFPDGKRLLTAGGDNTVRVWDVVTGTQLSAMTGTGRDGVVALSPNSKLAVTGKAKSAVLWDLETKTILRELQGHLANVTAVCFADQGKSIATADNTGIVRLWDAINGSLLWESRAHNSTVTAIRSLADGTLITASGDRTVGRWSILSGEENGPSLQHPDWVSGITISSDGATAITSCEDSIVRVWDLNTNKELGRFDVPSTLASASKNLRRLMRSQKINAAKLADESGVSVETIQAILNREQALNPSLARSLCDVLLEPIDSLLNPKVSSVAISSDGRFALTAVPDDRTVRIWDVQTFEEITAQGKDPGQPLLHLDGRQLWSAQFSNDDSAVITLGGSEARIWNRETGHEQMSLSPHGTVVSARYSPDNQRVVTASWDDTAKIWDAKSGKAIYRLAGQHRGNVNMATFSPSGTQVLTCSDDTTARVWNAKTGQATGVVLTGHQAAILSATYSSAGSRIVTASRDRTARVWDATTGKPLFTLRDASMKEEPGIRDLPSHELGVLCATFFHSGGDERIITGGEDGVVKVWSADSGTLLYRLDAHTSRVTSVAASPDGLRIVTGSQDTTAKIWDAIHGKEVLTLKGHTQEVTSVSFSPDGLAVLTGSRDGLAIVWPATNWESQTIPVEQNVTKASNGLTVE